MQLALLIQRAKVFDICRNLKYMLQVSPDNYTKLLTVAFRGGRDPSRPWLRRKSFWEMRATLVDKPRHRVCTARWEGKEVKKSQQSQNLFPCFYECLMLPFFSIESWMPVLLWFNLDPEKCRNSFVEVGRIQREIARLLFLVSLRALGTLIKVKRKLLGLSQAFLFAITLEWNRSIYIRTIAY
ncbi:hypothetical protein F5B19DRAFT_309007 [Rostrohypoxylon terebratum]|nr:hypothetical protein F5B19DRAFT_309007 [Rostrohypoxylon terebratum]